MKTDDTVTRRQARALDRALAGETGHGEPDGLLATASELRGAFDFDIPSASRERAMFVSGVGTRHHRLNPLRLFVPAVAFLALVLLAYLGGRTALPGDSLYPVRKALGSVGLAQSALEEIDARIGEATSLVSEAEQSLVESPGTSLRLAVRALEELGPAIDLLDELTGTELATREGEIEGLESRAVDVIGLVAQPGNDRGEGDDNSGPGSSGGDDDRSGSNSGSGSGGDDDDNSGPGDGDDDNSGPGSGDGDADDDNSGPGGGDDDDRSGSNSGPGSGDGVAEDNSGPGGGGDDDDDLPDVDEGRDGGGGDNSGPGGGDDDDDGVDLDDLGDDERDDDNEVDELLI
ncbi:MAG: hypothetical protein ACRDKT_12625 [Actinomycetota bacterium]